MTLSRQEIFTKAYNGLKSQGFQRSVSPIHFHSYSCRYRGANGMKCAVGWLMDDDKYTSSFEGYTPNGAYTLPEYWEAVNCSRDDSFFLKELQKAHDNGDTPELMINNLETVAGVHGLEIPND